MTMPTIAQLRTLRLFKTWTHAELAALARVARLRRLPTHAILFREGDVGDTGYAVLTGRVAIRKEALSHDERAITTLTIDPGEFFGELSLLDAGPRSSTAVTVEASTLLIITKRAFARLLLQHPRVGAKLFLLLIKRLGPRIRQMNTELMALYEVGKAIGASERLAPFVERLLTIAVRATAARRGLVFLANDVTGCWDVAASVGAVPPFDPPPLDDRDTRIGQCAQRREALLVNLASEPAAQPYESSIMLLVPILVDERVAGIVLLGDKRSETGHPVAFRQDDRNLCTTLAAQAASTIDRIKLTAENAAREQLKQVRFSL